MDVRTGSPVSTMTEAGLRTRGDQGRGVLAHPHRQVEAKSQRPAYAVTRRSVRPTLTLQGRVQRCEAPAEVSEPRIVPLVLWCKGAGEPRTGVGGGLSQVLHKTSICWNGRECLRRLSSLLWDELRADSKG